MNEKIKMIMSAGKIKATAIATCTALVLSLGTVTAFAADTEKVLVKNENGVMSYSEDEGATWNEGTPEGIITKDGTNGTLIKNGGPGQGERHSLTIKTEGDVTHYSTDGGETWSQTAPEGVTVNEDGSIIAKHMNPNGANENEIKILVKNKDGVINYSTDSGETWSQTAPEGAKAKEGSFVHMGLLRDM